uniref:Uncharacterized protein n=1 Tax=Oryza glumipatula TaxID=40148 RepID=A0A0E0AHX5_9ORYZ
MIKNINARVADRSNGLRGSGGAGPHRKQEERGPCRLRMVASRFWKSSSRPHDRRSPEPQSLTQAPKSPRSLEATVRLRSTTGC